MLSDEPHTYYRRTPAHVFYKKFTYMGNKCSECLINFRNSFVLLEQLLALINLMTNWYSFHHVCVFVSSLADKNSMTKNVFLVSGNMWTLVLIIFFMFLLFYVSPSSSIKYVSKIFQKTKMFYPLIRKTHVWVSGGNIFSFFGKFWVRTKLMTPYIWENST